MAISEERAIIGDTYGFSSSTPYFCIYERSHGLWVLDFVVTAPVPDGYSMASLDLAGDRAFVGVKGYPSSGPGWVDVYEPSAGGWVVTARFQASDSSPTQEFASSLRANRGIAVDVNSRSLV